MKISVIVCTHNRCNDLMRTLDSLASQDYLTSDYEVVVVDNCSTDRTKDVVDEFIRNYPPIPPLEKRGGIRKDDDAVNIRYIFEEKIGLSHARNRGIAESRGDVIAFIDDDAIAEKAWLSELMQVFVDEKDAACVGGRALLDWQVSKPLWWHQDLDEVFNGINYSDIRKEVAYPCYPYGTNIAFKTEILKKLGGFRIDLGRIGLRLLAGEETELCLKIEKNGYKIYFEPNAVVYHMVDPKKLNKSYIRRRAYWHGKSHAIIEFEHFGKKHINKNIRSYSKGIIKWPASMQYSIVKQKYYLFLLGYIIQGLKIDFHNNLK